MQATLEHHPAIVAAEKACLCAHEHQAGRQSCPFRMRVGLGEPTTCRRGACVCTWTFTPTATAGVLSSWLMLVAMLKRGSSGGPWVGVGRHGFCGLTRRLRVADTNPCPHFELPKLPTRTRFPRGPLERLCSIHTRRCEEFRAAKSALWCPRPFVGRPTSDLPCLCRESTGC